MSLCGKKVKMNYLQCQRIERNKCESNMIFLGFVYYRKAHFGEYNPGISWWEIYIIIIDPMNVINNSIINNNIYDKKKTIIINYFFINSFILIKINFNYCNYK